MYQKNTMLDFTKHSAPILTIVHTVNVKCIHLFATCMFKRLAGQQPSDLPRNSEMIPLAMTYYSVKNKFKY